MPDSTKRSPFSDVVQINRRGFMLSGGAIAAGAAAGATVTLGADDAAAQAGSVAGALPNSSFKVGEFEVMTLLDGAVTAKEPQKTFGMKQTAERFADVSAANFIPSDKFRAYFTPTLIKGAGEVILFDTGLGEGARPARGNLTLALAGAGVKPEDVTVVVLTHMHPDHVGGLMSGGKAAFPNARYVIGQAEFDFWSKMDPSHRVAKLFNANVKPLAEKATFVKGGDKVVSGVEAFEAFGHTPGHMTFVVESGGQQLHLLADTANHFVWSLAYPDWEVRFDMDKGAAAATRRKVFDMLAADKTPFVGYHLPFPAVGFVEKGSGDAAFRYVAASYQMSL